MKNLIFSLLCFASASFAAADADSIDSVKSVATEMGADSSMSEAVDSNAVFRVDKIRYHIGDAFDDSKAHTKYDRWAYDILNWVHIETREITVRKLLLFDKGDLVNLNLLLESERFLRNQKFLSDANITVSNEDGKNIVDVQTSDNWTLTIPIAFGFSGSEWSYDNLVWGVGIQESNFLGLGQKLGFYFGHDEFRDMWQVEYGDPHFLFRYNHLDFLYSYNTDGYLASWKMYVPFLSRSVNQWAYTLEGLKNKRNAFYYGRGELPTGAKIYDYTKNQFFLKQLEIAHKDPDNKKKSEREIDSIATNKYLNTLSRYNGKKSVKLMAIEDFITDSLSFRFSRSFGGTQRKLYLGATYDYLRETANEGLVLRYPFIYGDKVYAIDSASAVNDWTQERKDSRLGLYIMYSNLRYEKIKNFHNVRWTEDIDKGFSIKAQLSKNYEQLGANNNDIRLDFWTDLYLGRQNHHLTLKSYMYFYLDHGKRHDFYGRLNGEYIFHPSTRFSTALSGLVDLYDDAKLGYQLTLGGSDGFVGFPTGFYAGQARVYGNLEQRWFPDFEILTLAPVVVAFGSVGETAASIKDIRRKNLIYVAGFGIRLAQTKSITRLINKIDVSFPLNGARKGDAHYSVTTSYSL
ncbi:hypothetical protein [Fibrobacter sp. UWB11]|uniref:hypothetical protein n=1 Tax=Fibrobacter sp. UWB11 TaxID=1896202 RepID=UPI000928C600|nr:hypothetical protein [Fibrobacter sp. UWB11]SIN84748.1 hypothetical protein SAMN05720758_0217 [Fibrobacter sp. UWB11]